MEIDDFFAHVEMNETTDYLRRGRIHSGLTTDELRERWLSALRAAFFGNGNVQEMDDFGAELRLRGLEVPEDQLTRAEKEEFARLAQAATEHEPTRAQVREELRRYFAARAKPPN